MTAITLVVNGVSHDLEVEPNTPLLWVLRDQVGATGTKFSCGIGQCGACTVHVDGQAVHSCTVSALEVNGSQITTIEGLSPDGTHPLQRAWMEEHVSQCGYCQPGQIMAAAALLTNNPKPSDAEIAEAMSDNLCRCGSYGRILKAIHNVIEEG